MLYFTSGSLRLYISLSAESEGGYNCLKWRCVTSQEQHVSYHSWSCHQVIAGTAVTAALIGISYLVICLLSAVTISMEISVEMEFLSPPRDVHVWWSVILVSSPIFSAFRAGRWGSFSCLSISPIQIRGAFHLSSEYLHLIPRFRSLLGQSSTSRCTRRWMQVFVPVTVIACCKLIL